MHRRGLHQVQREHSDFGVLAVGAGEIAVVAVADDLVAGVQLLDDLQSAVDFPAQCRAGEAVAKRR